MKYPSKLYSVRESVVGKMTMLMEIIPEEGVGVEDFYYMTHKLMCIADFMDAVTCLYMIGAIDVTRENVLFKIC